MKKTNCVIVDDDAELTDLLKAFFADDFQVLTFAGGGDALEFLKKSQDAAIILCDLQLPDMSGLQVITEQRKFSSFSPVIIITAHESKDTAIEAIQRGAFDYITKPLDFSDLKVVTDRALRFLQLRLENHRLTEQIKGKNSYANLLGKSAKMRGLFALIEKVASSPSNVLVTGESGSGKEMVARALHNEGVRKHKEFVAVNCSAIPRELLESELFGHKRGAFTGAITDRVGLFETAQGGSIFLDEIGDMPLDLQAKLLRVLQERKIRPVGKNRDTSIDVRVIAATHCDLGEMVRDGEFREDLFYRLNVIPIKVPPLRDRKEDIPLLASAFLEKYRQFNSAVEDFSPEALQKLVSLRWTGNVRELENTIERAVMLASDRLIAENDISVEMDARQESQIGRLFTRLPTLKQLEKEYIQFVLMREDKSKEQVARILGVDRKTLYRKQKDYDI